MLRDLSIRDVLLIEALDLEFKPGLNVLTGETGAGKSILLDSLGFVLGWLGRADIVRQGAAQGEVTAVFDLPADHPAHAVLDAAGIPAEDGQIVLRRINGGDGRKRGFVNDRRVSGDVLRALSETLVELHGQQDDKGLLDPRQHRVLLDAFGGLELRREAVRTAWRDWAAARKAREAAEAAAAEAARDAEYLRHAAAELSDLAPVAGEEEELDTRRRQMQMAAKIGEDIDRAAQAMGPDGAEGRLGEAMRWLESVADRAEGTLDGALDALSRTLAELGEAQGAVAAQLDAMQFDPHELERVEERLFALRGLARKHNCLPEDLPELAETLAAKLSMIEGGAEEVQRLAEAEAATWAAYLDAAGVLSKARLAAARKLDKAMAGELAPLKLDAAQFATDIEALDEGAAGPDGLDRVSFVVATNPGAPPGPLARIASGGELSRFLLALKVCLSGRSQGLTMIFDEIDRGVGGATADAVGRRLSRVADGSQVLVVTHSPQVAARGAHHFQVSKSSKGGETRTEVVALPQTARVDEIARMLAGDTITDEARSAAVALLDG